MKSLSCYILSTICVEFRHTSLTIYTMHVFVPMDIYFQFFNLSNDIIISCVVQVGFFHDFLCLAIMLTRIHQAWQSVSACIIKVCAVLQKPISMNLNDVIRLTINHCVMLFVCCATSLNPMIWFEMVQKIIKHKEQYSIFHRNSFSCTIRSLCTCYHVWNDPNRLVDDVATWWNFL